MFLLQYKMQLVSSSPKDIESQSIGHISHFVNALTQWGVIHYTQALLSNSTKKISRLWLRAC